MARIPNTTYTIFDDFSGEELPEDTKPKRYSLLGRQYDLYLSEDSKEQVDAFLDNLIKGVDAVGGPAPKATTTGKSLPIDKHGYEIADVRAWAVEQGLQNANGTPVSAGATRLAQPIWDAYRDAHK